MRKSEEVKELIVNDRKSGSTLKQIAEKYKLSIPGVKKIVDNFEHRGSVKTLYGGGRKRSTTAQTDRLIYRQARESPFISARSIKENLNLSVSVSTIQRRLKSRGLKSFVSKKRPLISQKNRKHRLQFARKYVNKPISFWKSIIWSDESKFELKNPKKRQLVWCTQKDRLRPKFVQQTVKHGGGSIMVWGCFSFSGVGNLVKINGKMTGAHYVSILNENLNESARKMNLDRFIFQQDNDPKHTSRVATQYFTENQIEKLEWPAQSPDCNPIEHLWSILDTKIPLSARQNMQIFWNELQRQWDAISQEILQNLVNSMPKRLLAVIENKGCNTKF